MDVVFVRHGTPDYQLSDERKMCQLEKDYAPLDRSGIAHIQLQSQKSVFDNADVIVSSPYTRALQTAEIINRKLQLDLFVEHDLREWKADTTGGYITLAERDRRWVEYRSLLKSSQLMVDKPYEVVEDLSMRVNSVLDQYSEYQKIIVVSHFNVLESLIGFQDNGIKCGEFFQFEY